MKLSVAVLLLASLLHSMTSLAQATRSDHGIREALAKLVPWDGSVEDEGPTKAFRDLLARIKAKDLNDSDVEDLLSACLRGDPNTVPVSPSWRIKYLMLLEAYWSSYASVHSLEYSGYEIPIDVVTDRKRFNGSEDGSWPAHTALPIGLFVWKAWRPSLGNDVRAVVESPDAVASEASAEGAIYVTVPPLEVGKHEISIRVEVGRKDSAGVVHLVQTKRVTIELNVVDAMPRLVPKEVPEIQAALEKYLSIRLGSMVTGNDAATPDRLSHFLVMSLPSNQLKQLLHKRGVLGLSIELLDCSGEVRLRSYCGLASTSETWDSESMDISQKQIREGWTARVRASVGIAEFMLSESDSQNERQPENSEIFYWSGEFTLPVGYGLE